MPILQQHGGALLADAVGLGKTFVALAIARAYERVDVIAPAGLLSMWRDTSARCQMQPAPRCHSVHQFSYGTVGAPLAAAERLVIIDEAHHLRNPHTQRYANVAQHCRSAHVLLLTATPVHNRASDLSHLLALFLGTRAETLSAAEQLALMVRRDASVLDDTHEHTHDTTQQATRPTLRTHPAVPLRAGNDVANTSRAIAQALADLPPPVPTRDGTAAGALIALGLLRSWCSSAAACLSAVRRRRARALALAEVLAQGKWPTHQELRTWTISEDTVQLGFTSLLVRGDALSSTQSAAELALAGETSFADFIARARAQLETHQQALATLEMLLRRTESSLDRARAECLRRVRRRHPGVAVIVFSQFADSVHAMGRVLRWDVGVATLTARGGRVAGGPLTRAELLRRVAPRAHGVAPPPPHERILLLITTDLLAEGVNLQDAAVVVHLDLPWTPAAIAQREGRIARLGSIHRLVHAHSIAPPGDAEAVLRIAERLRRKARAASVVLAPDAPPRRARRLVAVASVSSPTHDTLRRWQRACTTGADSPRERVVPHARAGWLAAVNGELVGGWFAVSVSHRAASGTPATTRTAADAVADAAAHTSVTTITRIRTSASRDPRAIAALVRAVDLSVDRAIDHSPCTGPIQAASPQESRDIASFTYAVRAALRREVRQGQRLAVVHTLQSPLVRAQRQIRRTYAAVSLADRVRLAPLAAAASRTVRALRGAGDERALGALLEPGALAQLPEDWLRAIVSLAAQSPGSTGGTAIVPIAPIGPIAAHGSASDLDVRPDLNAHAPWHTLLLLLPR